MLHVINKFSATTGFVVNPNKCRIYFGGVDGTTKSKIQQISSYEEGQLPVRYLGVPLTSKKLNIKYYLPLIDKITTRIRHWTSKLLSIAGRVQMVNCTITAICLPIPMSVIKKIDSMCRSFVWSGSTEITRKSLIAWNSVCRPKGQGGLNIFNLKVWNHIAMLKCLWNLCKKADNLWVKWIHAHYIKNSSVMNTMITNNFSWVLKNVLSQREYIHTLQPVWDELLNSERFKMKKAYDKMMEADRVHWSGLVRKNCARPRAIHTTWLACHGRLGTKDRLVRFGMITDKICSLCKEVEETQNHILFSCKIATDIWSNVLNWIGIDHVPQEWPLELDWLLNLTNRKGWRAYLLKLSVTETIYGIWIHRNSKIFGDNTYRNTSKDVSDGIIENIVYRGWGSKKLRKHIASLMI
ncbi:putative ribonuclease H protein [Glycine max]|nr:putative ribonuclease H protein [Glycine max]